MTVQHLGNALIWLGSLASGLIALAVIGRYVIVRPLKRWIAQQLQEHIQPIAAEVTHDHGASLKDSTVRTEQKVDSLAADLREHINHHPGASRWRWR